MKRIVVVVLILALLMMVGCSPDVAKEEKATKVEETEAVEAEVVDGVTPRPAQEVADQGYDFYDKAVSYDDIDLGPIPRPDGPLALGFVCKAFDNEFWAANKDGALAAAAEFKELGMDITYDVRAAQGESDDQGQLAVLNDMINKGYDGIVLSPIAEGNLLPGVEKAVAKGIPMVVNNDAFMPEIDVTAGVWHWEGGLLAAEYINDLLDGKGKVVIIQGNLKTPPARSRTDAFVKWCEDNNPDIEVLDIQQADWDRLKAKDITDTWLKTYPDIDAIFCNNDTMAMGALEAVKSAEKDIFIVGIDGTGEARASIKAGELTATVDSFPLFLSRISTEMLLRKIGGQTPPMVIYTPQAIVDSSNVDEDPATLIGWTGFDFAD